MAINFDLDTNSILQSLFGGGGEAAASMVQGKPSNMPNMEQDNSVMSSLMQGQRPKDPIVEDLLSNIDLGSKMDKREAEIMDERDRLREQLKQTREGYRDESIDKFMSKKGKWGKLLLGLTEFASGLGGQPGQLARMQAMANQDYDSNRRDIHEQLSALDRDFGQINANRKQELAQLKATSQEALSSRRIDLDQEYKQGALELQKAKLAQQFGMDASKLENDAVTRMLKMAQIENMANGNEPKTPAALAKWLYSRGKLDENSMKKFLIKEKSAPQPSYSITTQTPDGRNRVTQRIPGLAPKDAFKVSTKEDDDEFASISGGKKN